MSNAIPNLLLVALSLGSMAAFLTVSDAAARGFHARGARGALGAYGRQGQYGRGGAFGAVSQNAGLVGAGVNATGPYGGSAVGGGVAGWKKGVGGFRASQMNMTGANGSTYNGYKQGKYNAQTGQGTYSSGKSAYNANTGQSYGYNQDTSYMKGQGATTSLETQNKGDYTVDWNKGQKPVVTPVPAE